MTPTACAGLLAAIKGATAAVTLGLPAGPCAIPSLNNVNPPAVVTITSADPANPAIITALRIAASSNIKFDTLTMTFDSSNDSTPTTRGYYAYRISNSHDLTFNNLEVHGDLTLAPSAQLTAFYFASVKNVAFTNSRIHDTNIGILIGDSTNLSITGNDVRRTAKSGLQFSGLVNTVIAKNHISDMYPAIGVHPDAIQGFTEGAKQQGDGLTITDNAISVGAGVPVQGILIQDDAFDRATGARTRRMPWLNVDIERNTVLGEQWNSIRLDGYGGKTTISDNTALSQTGSANDGTKKTFDFYGVIWTFNPAPGTQLTTRGNTAQGYVIDGARGWTPPGNRLMSTK